MCTLPVGTYWGVSVRLHLTFLLLLALEIVNAILRHGNFPFAALIFLVDGPILFFTIVVNGLCHALASWKLGTCPVA